MPTLNITLFTTTTTTTTTRRPGGCGARDAQRSRRDSAHTDRKRFSRNDIRSEFHRFDTTGQPAYEQQHVGGIDDRCAQYHRHADRVTSKVVGVRHTRPDTGDETDADRQVRTRRPSAMPYRLCRKNDRRVDELRTTSANRITVRSPIGSYKNAVNLGGKDEPGLNRASSCVRRCSAGGLR